MPVGHVVDNAASLFVFRFHGRVTEAEVTGAIDALAEAADHAGSYRELLLFERSTDLSELTSAALNRIKERMKAVYEPIEEREPTGAAVIDSSSEAKTIMPLWNALCDGDPELDQHYEVFVDLESARRWLGLGREECAAAVSRTGRAPE